MKRTIILILIIIFTAKSYSQDSLKIEKKPSGIAIAVGLSASSNGLGGSVITSLNKYFAIRLSYEGLSNNTIQTIYPINEPTSITISDQEFSLIPSIQVGGLSGIVDFYFAKSLYISAGVMYTNFNLTGNTNLDKLTINKVTLENQGGLSFSILPERKLSPYVGLGFGRNISRDKRFAMNFEMGAYHMGSYVLSLTGTGLLEGNNTESLKTLNETLKDISWSGIYPVLKLGVSYKIWKK